MVKQLLLLALGVLTVIAAVEAQEANVRDPRQRIQGAIGELDKLETQFVKAEKRSVDVRDGLSRAEKAISSGNPTRGMGMSSRAGEQASATGVVDANQLKTSSSSDTYAYSSKPSLGAGNTGSTTLSSQSSSSSLKGTGGAGLAEPMRAGERTTQGSSPLGQPGGSSSSQTRTGADNTVAVSQGEATTSSLDPPEALDGAKKQRVLSGPLLSVPAKVPEKQLTLPEKIAEVQSVVRRLANMPSESISPVLKDEIVSLYRMAVRVKEAAGAAIQGKSSA